MKKTLILLALPIMSALTGCVAYGDGYPQAGPAYYDQPYSSSGYYTNVPADTSITIWNDNPGYYGSGGYYNYRDYPNYRGWYGNDNWNHNNNWHNNGNNGNNWNHGGNNGSVVNNAERLPMKPPKSPSPMPRPGNGGHSDGPQQGQRGEGNGGGGWSNGGNEHNH